MESDAPRKVAAVVLAAGRSSRMGDTNKLLVEAWGKALVRHAVEAAVGSLASPVVVVTGFEADRIEACLAGLPVTIAYNGDYGRGISTSLQCGIAALPVDAEGAIICLADMPGVQAGHLDRLIGAFDPEMDRAVCVPSHNGRRGNPVLWSRLFFPEIMALTGDEGARKLLRKHGPVVHKVEMASGAILWDVDTPDALVGLLRD